MKLAVQTAPVIDRFGVDEGFRMIHEAGFDAVDLNIDHFLSYSDIVNGRISGFYAMTDEEMLEGCRPFKEAAAKHGISFTQAHAPFPNRVPGNDEMTAFVLHAVKKTIMCCDYLDCRNLIVHPAHNRSDRSISLEDEWNFNMRMYTELIPELKKYNVTCCLENMFAGQRGKIMESACTNAADANRYIDALNDLAGEKCFGFCLDVGHALLTGKDIYPYILELGDRIVALHIHDNNGLDDEHLAPYMGVTDWDRFCMGLKEIGYDHDLSFETFRAIETFDLALAPQMLGLIAATGRLFRERIQG